MDVNDKKKEKLRPGKTNVQISDELWKQLNDYKIKPNESFNDVIKKILDQAEEEGGEVK